MTGLFSIAALSCSMAPIIYPRSDRLLSEI
jgi:hypothetical protein